MKIILALLINITFIAECGATTNVHGYSKRNGSYVSPHRRTDSNHTQRDNWSTKGNINPDTGKKGTKNASH
jgi:hypothetical protein